MERLDHTIVSGLEFLHNFVQEVLESVFLTLNDTQGQGGFWDNISGTPGGSLCSPPDARIIVPERPPAPVCKDTVILMRVIRFVSNLFSIEEMCGL